jgi:hypothetical protein
MDAYQRNYTITDKKPTQVGRSSVPFRVGFECPPMKSPKRPKKRALMPDGDQPAGDILEAIRQGSRRPPFH